MKRNRRNRRGLISRPFLRCVAKLPQWRRGAARLAQSRPRSAISALARTGERTPHDSQAAFARRPPARPRVRRFRPARRAAPQQRKQERPAAVRGAGPLPGDHRGGGAAAMFRHGRGGARSGGASGATSSSSTAPRSARAGAGCSASLCRACRSSAAATTADPDEDEITQLEGTVASAQPGRPRPLGGAARRTAACGSRPTTTCWRCAPRPGQPVVIHRAALGSYMMRVNSQPGVRVRRQL